MLLTDHMIMYFCELLTPYLTISLNNGNYADISGDSSPHDGCGCYEDVQHSQTPVQYPQFTAGLTFGAPW